MTVKLRTVHRCTECGAEYPKWGGRCDACGEWNTLVEEVLRPAAGSRASRPPAAATAAVGSTPQRLGNVDSPAARRLTSSIRELDFVLGGGIVPGSVVLVGGEPGIGKSTLLLQAAAGLVAPGERVLYVSAEESAAQIRLRADRLGDSALEVDLLSETDLERIVAAAASLRPILLVIDSIQTIAAEELEGVPGSVGQVRECAARLARFAKDSGVSVFIVGHVTKGGGVAGPRTLEHIVDTVLYFEGEGSLEFRILRATKNRFGSVDEIGVFRMTAQGLVAVDSPSELFLGEHRDSSSGTAVAALIEGTRPVLVEIQALATKSGYGTPQRVATGVDPRRLALLLAVLEKRAGLPCSQLDIFVNVAGGLRLTETAADLAILAAVASSIRDAPLPDRCVFIGEIGLGGEIRSVSQVERRLGEAVQLGMREAVLARRGLPKRPPAGLMLRPSDDVRSLFAALFRR